MGLGSVRDDDLQSAWYSTFRPSGINVADTFEEIKQFAYHSFDLMDENKDGFITREELQEYRKRESTPMREKSFVSFLLVRLDDIKDAYHEEWHPVNDGISRADIQEYFKQIVMPQ